MVEEVLGVRCSVLDVFEAIYYMYSNGEEIVCLVSDRRCMLTEVVNWKIMVWYTVEQCSCDELAEEGKDGLDV